MNQLYCFVIVKDKNGIDRAIVNDEQLKKFKKENGHWDKEH